MDMGLSKLQEMVKDREAWHAAVHGATGKTIALTRQTFVGKVMPLLFNMLSMFVIDFLQEASIR